MISKFFLTIAGLILVGIIIKIGIILYGIPFNEWGLTEYIAAFLSVLTFGSFLRN
jgi:hypothetical protein